MAHWIASLIPSFEGVSSDHRIVTAKIRLSLRKNATRTITSKQIDIKRRPFTQEEFDLVQRKNWNRKTAGLDEIPLQVWNARQFDILLQQCDAVVRPPPNYDEKYQN